MRVKDWLELLKRRTAFVARLLRVNDKGFPLEDLDSRRVVSLALIACDIVVVLTTLNVKTKFLLTVIFQD